jgi:hypothetical protein
MMYCGPWVPHRSLILAYSADSVRHRLTILPLRPPDTQREVQRNDVCDNANDGEAKK